MSSPSQRRIGLATGLECSFLEWNGEDSTLEHTVVLLHGFLDFSWSWFHTVNEGLAKDFHVVCPDMRGHGDSDGVGAGGYYYFFDYIADLASFIENLGRRRVSIVGHSMGGSVASYFTGTYPERVSRLALLEGLGPPEMSGPLPDRVRGWITSWRRSLLKENSVYPSIAEAAARLRKHDPLLTEERALFFAEHGTRRTNDGFQFKHDPRHLTAGPYPYRRDVAEQFWRCIQCPVLIVDGEVSTFRLATDDANARIQCFSDPVRASIADAGHMMQRHNPSALAALLHSFLVV